MMWFKLSRSEDWDGTGELSLIVCEAGFEVAGFGIEADDDAAGSSTLDFM